MNRLRLFGLGLRLVAGGGRAGVLRLLLSAIGVGVGTALLVGGLGIDPAIQARHAREDARSPIVAPEGRSRDVLLLATARDHADSVDLLRFTVAEVGRGPVPPGLSRIPRPGEVTLSPALARFLASSEHGALVRERLPSLIAGTVGPAGLVSPDEFVAYVGADPSFLRSVDTPPVVAFGPGPIGERGPLGLGLKLLILVAVLGLVIPILVFVVTSTRLSASYRERRLAAIRLVGATPAEARVLAAVESGVAGLLGSLLGLGLFFALRPLVARLPLAGYHWFPSDIAPPPIQAAGLLLAVPVLAVGASILGLRRLIVTPLGVVRRSRSLRLSPWRLVPLMAGFTGFGLCWGYRSTIERGGMGSLVLFGGSLVLVLAGVALTAAWPGPVLAAMLARDTRRVGTLIGARRIQADPGASGRVVATFGLLVLVGGLVHALVPPGEYLSGGPDIGRRLRPDALLIQGQVRPDEIVAALGPVAGVSAVAPLARVNLTGTELVADCRDLRRPLDASFPRCSPSTAYLAKDVVLEDMDIRPGQRVEVRPWPDEEVVATMRLPTIFEPTSLDVPALNATMVLPPTAIPQEIAAHLQADRVLVATDGAAATAEQVRNAVAKLNPSAEALSLEQVRARSEHTSRQLTALVDLGILAALGIALANLLVVSVDQVQERRRPFAVLAAAGVPARVLRRSVLTGVAVPLLATVALAAGLSVVLAALIGDIISLPIAVPLGRLAILAGMAVGVVAVVTALTLPGISGATRPEALQFE